MAWSKSPLLVGHYEDYMGSYYPTSTWLKEEHPDRMMGIPTKVYKVVGPCFLDRGRTCELPVLSS